MHLNFCFNCGIIANLGPIKFELLLITKWSLTLHYLTMRKQMFTNGIIGFIIWRVKVSLPHHLTVLNLMKIEMPIT